MLMRSLLISTLVFVCSEQVTAATSIVVKAGDTLTSIANEELGDAKQWSTLCELNRDVLANCNNLPIGTVLRTVSNPASSSTQKNAENQNGLEGDVQDYVTNGDFSSGLDGWDSRADAEVTKSVSNGQLILTRGPAGDIAGAATQVLSLEPDSLYEMTVKVYEAPAAFRLTNSDQNYVPLDVGVNTILVTTSPAIEGEWLLYIWPLARGSLVRIDDISIVDAQQ